MILNRTYLTDHFLIIVAPQMLKYILAILWNPFNIIDLCYLNEINNAKRNHLIILYELFNETFPLIIIQYQDILYHFGYLDQYRYSCLYYCLDNETIDIYTWIVQSIQKWDKSIIFFIFTLLCKMFFKFNDR